jgi:hypothetical protein
MLSTCLDLALLCHPVVAFLSLSRPKKQIQTSKMQYFVVSFLSILAIRYASASSYAAPAVQNQTTMGACQTYDSPNPIAELYPNNATGTLNGTVAIIPISLDLARSIIPPQYRILEHAYRALLPSFPKDMYPAVIQALHDHEVQAFGYLIPDFSVSLPCFPFSYTQLTKPQRTGIEFPFLDLLGDNSTSFKWAPSMLMTSGHEIAIKGAMDYGTHVFPAAFDPPCDAYRAVPGAKDTTTFNAKSSEARVHTQFSRAPSDMAFPLEMFKNVTNQPTFADGKTCDNMIRLFDTSVTVAIESVRGDVKARIPPFTKEEEWSDVYGIRLDSAFIENNYLPCENFRGYGTP